LVIPLLPDAGAAGDSAARLVAGSAQASRDAAIIAPTDRIVFSRE
jgi:hypothetical protein